MILDANTNSLVYADAYTRTVLANAPKAGFRTTTMADREGTIYYEPNGSAFLRYVVAGVATWKGRPVASIDKVSYKCTARSLPAFEEQLRVAQEAVKAAAAEAEEFRSNNPSLEANLPPVAHPKRLGACEKLEDLALGSEHLVVALSPITYRGSERYVFRLHGREEHFGSNTFFEEAFRGNTALAARPFHMHIVGMHTTKTKKKAMRVDLV